MMAQDPNVQQDKKDSARFYRTIQTFSYKHRFTKAVYRLFFRPVREDKPGLPPVAVASQVKPNYFKQYEGKVIRDIDIVTLDPFGYDVKDTAVHPENFLQRSGNYLHIKTQTLTVRNRLIIKKHDTFDSLRVKESERLLRAEPFIREVYFYPKIVEGTDSVDIYIRVYDNWSIIAVADVSPTHFKIDTKDKNFGGLGHQLDNNYSYDNGTGHYMNTTNYFVSNIRNTFISTTLHYDVDNFQNYNESVSIDRPFYSIFTRWAGGIYLLQHFNRALLKNEDSTLYTQSFKENVQDYWLGRSWQVSRGKSVDARTTNLILAGRYYNVHYIERQAIDSLVQYPEEHLYLGALSLSRRKYVQDSYLFRYGFVEDVPTGRTFSLISGYQTKNNIGRVYLGARTYWGEYYKFGYVGAMAEYGEFLHSGRREEACFTVGTSYFSPLLRLGRWRFRQFAKSQYVIGLDRTKTQSITINDGYGISGFNSTGLTGTEKVVVTMQTQSYAPWIILGFRFGPYLVASAGMLGNEKSGFHNSPVYSQVGFGLLIRNEYLVFNSFEISVAFFPFMPGVGNNLFRVNPYNTTDFGLLDSGAGKPSTIGYQ